MRGQKSPTAWVKTTRRWDIIGRGIGKGVGGFVVLHLAWRKDRLPFPHVDTRVEPRKFRKRGATWKWTRREEGGQPCRPSKWFSESRQA